MREEERPGDVQLSMEGRLIERLFIILKVGCGGHGEDGEKINITYLYLWRREEVEEEI